MKSFFQRFRKGSTPQSNIADEDYFRSLRNREFSRLDKENHVYLDYTGGNLYPESLLKKHHKLLSEGVLGNPHSSNPTSQKATKLVEEARQAVLDFFNASDDYYCVFTQNASAALKIIGECYPFNANSSLVMLADNHNSVNGIREFCKGKTGNAVYVPVQYEDLRINDEVLNEELTKHSFSESKLFAFPAQSNVSGVKHDLRWIERAQKMGYHVLLDAAAYVPANPLDLKSITPDFVSVSFYKIFGYPTGIGCLLLRKSTYDILQKPWFAGGTVTLVSVASQEKFLAEGHERFEDGTLDYVNIPAVKMGLDFMNEIGMQRLQNRMKALIEEAISRLSAIKHDNGKPVLRIFGPADVAHRGSNMIMNFFDPEGNVYPFELIEDKANKRMISIRSGCFCNPGIDEINNCLSNDELAKYYVSRDKGDYYDMIKFLGKMRGAIRLSVGMATVESDLQAFENFVQSLVNQQITEGIPA